MKFHLLGPLEIRTSDDELLEISQPLHRAVLAVLLLRPDRPCSQAWLADVVWGDHVPRDPGSAIRTCVYGVRRRLGEARGRLRTGPVGYLMHVLPGELDLQAFRDLHAQGRGALDRGEVAEAARLLQQALGLWRDPPLADLPSSPAVAEDVARLQDQRLDAQDALLDARLALGEHRAIVAQLRGIVAADPLREHAWAQLMHALYRCGHKSAAIAAFGAGRKAVLSELGAEPSPELQHLLQLILRDDPSL